MQESYSQIQKMSISNLFASILYAIFCYLRQISSSSKRTFVQYAGLFFHVIFFVFCLCEYLYVYYACSHRLSHQLSAKAKKGNQAPRNRYAIPKPKKAPHPFFLNNAAPSSRLYPGFYLILGLCAVSFFVTKNPAISACSNFNSFIFLSIPPAYPVRLPFVPTTR